MVHQTPLLIDIDGMESFVRRLFWSYPSVFQEAFAHLQNTHESLAQSEDTEAGL
jgi:hypothetical protein